MFTNKELKIAKLVQTVTATQNLLLDQTCYIRRNVVVT